VAAKRAECLRLPSAWGRWRRRLHAFLKAAQHGSQEHSSATTTTESTVYYYNLAPCAQVETKWRPAVILCSMHLSLSSIHCKLRVRPWCWRMAGGVSDGRCMAFTVGDMCTVLLRGVAQHGSGGTRAPNLQPQIQTKCSTVTYDTAAPQQSPGLAVTNTITSSMRRCKNAGLSANPRCQGAGEPVSATRLRVGSDQRCSHCSAVRKHSKQGQQPLTQLLQTN
jgi:hypothetical protein